MPGLGVHIVLQRHVECRYAVHWNAMSNCGGSYLGMVAGHGNILIDPTVAVAYDHAASGHLAVSPARGIGTFKGDPFAPVKFTEGKPSDFMCHGLSGSGRHPNMVSRWINSHEHRERFTEGLHRSRRE